MRREKRRAAAFFKPPPESRRPKRFDFLVLSTVESVQRALQKAFRGKCAYCESPTSAVLPFDVENWRPKIKAMGMDGVFDEDHYWWLAYEWFNLYTSCLDCARLKGSRFPIKGTRASPGAGRAALRREQPLLLDPCEDYPETHLCFDELAQLASPTERGRVTIDVLGLNRNPLVQERRETLTSLQAGWQVILARARQGARLTRRDLDAMQFESPGLPYLGLRRQFLQHWSRQAVAEMPRLEAALGRYLRFRTALPEEEESTAVQAKVESTVKEFHEHIARQESYSVEDDTRVEDYYRKARFIERIEIRNFRLFQDLSITCPPRSKAGSCLVLLGENGTGKSSVLQGVALALMGHDHRLRIENLDARDYVRRGTEEGFVRVYLTGDTEPVELRFNSHSATFSARPDNPKVLLLGYGATRLLPRGASPPSPTVAAKADHLFSPFTPLNDAESWLVSLGETEFTRMTQGLCDLLMLDRDDRIFLETNGRTRVRVEALGTIGPLNALSDGYQSVLALATDIMSVMKLRWPDMESAEGIVLIDEIDAHLHPRWRMAIVPRLRKVFRNIQFIMTSHDPLTLRELEAHEVLVMRRDHNDVVHTITDLPSPKHLRVEQLLTSEFFGLNSVYSVEVEGQFQEYYGLLAKRKLSAPEKKRLQELKRELDGAGVLGANRRERLMLEAADRFLAEEPNLADPVKRGKHREKTLSEIANMWETVPPARARR
jgi:predicted ATPase